MAAETAMLHITDKMVEEKLDPRIAIQLAREAYLKAATGKILSPSRVWLSTNQGLSVYCMPSHVMNGSTVSVKIARVNSSNRKHGLPSVQATIHVYDSGMGEELARIDAAALTAIRTAASTGLATDFLARREASTLGLFGTGTQAEYHVPAINNVRPLDQVLVYSRSRARREKFARRISQKYKVRAGAADTPREVAKEADILVLATSSEKPVLDGRTVRPGTHVSAIGAAKPDAREVDTALVKRSLVVVDSKAQALTSYGDIAIPLKQGAIRKSQVRELGELLQHPEKLKITGEETTLFKSGGIAALDGVVVEHLMSKLQ